jgi:hypothetical protein
MLFHGSWHVTGDIGYNVSMMRQVLVCVLPAVLLFVGCARSVDAQGVDEPIYRFDPALSIEAPRPVTLSAGPPVIIEKDDSKASVRMQTEGPFAPYVGAERAPELSPEELRLLADHQELEGLPDYQLEAGVGLHVEDKASLSLGYRFSNPPSLLDERRNDPLTLSGDLRISFDIKVPFD